jgi:hypothetical protein
MSEILPGELLAFGKPSPGVVWGSVGDPEAFDHREFDCFYGFPRRNSVMDPRGAWVSKPGIARASGARPGTFEWPETEKSRQRPENGQSFHCPILERRYAYDRPALDGG